MDDFSHDDMPASEMDAEKKTYRVVEEFDLNGEPQAIDDTLELTSEEAAPYMAHLELVTEDKEDEDDDWDDDDDEDMDEDDDDDDLDDDDDI